MPALAVEKSFHLTVDAGKHDRSNTPVRVLIELPRELAKAKGVALVDPDGNKQVAQLTAPALLNQQDKGKSGSVVRELHFVLSELGKGKRLELTATVSSEEATAADGFSWERVRDQYEELCFGSRPVMRYVCQPFDQSSEEIAKATFRVFHHLYNPAGTRLVTKGPGGKYQHHRGLFFSYNNINYGSAKRVNPWAGPGYGDAFETHEEFLDQEAGPVVGRHQVAIDWHENDKKVFVKEKREMTVYNVPGGTLVEFATRVASTVGKVELRGNVHHSGFQFRADDEVATKTNKLTYYVRPDGRGEQGTFINEIPNLPWDAMSFVLAGKRYTVALLGHPANAKETIWGERNYGRFGTSFPYDLDEGKDLTVKYRVWLQDGEMTVDQVAALHADFSEPVQITVK